MKFDAIIFDKDGTLIDFDTFWVKVTEKTMRTVLDKFGITRVDLSELMELVGVKDGVTSVDGLLCCGTNRGIGEAIYELLISRGYGFDVEDVCRVVDEAFVNSIDAGELKPTSPDLCDTLKELKAMGIKLAVVTNDVETVTKKCLQGIGVFRLFDKIYTDDGISPTKPDPYFANDLCEKWGLDKERVLMVGDTMTDVKFARNAGIKVAYLTKSEEAREKMLSVADFVLPDPSYLKGVTE